MPAALPPATTSAPLTAHVQKGVQRLDPVVRWSRPLVAAALLKPRAAGMRLTGRPRRRASAAATYPHARGLVAAAQARDP